MKNQNQIPVNPIAITGVGIACAPANNKESFYHALRHPDYSNFKYSSRVKLDIDVKVFEAEDICFTHPSDTLFDNPTSEICLTAAKECHYDLLSKSGNKKIDGLFVGTSTGGQYLSEQFIFALLQNQKFDFNYHSQGLMSSPARLIAQELHIQGRIQTISTACTSSANAIAIAASYLESGRCHRVMAGGGDALCATTIAGFHILKLTGSKQCKPFANHRPGMNLGDGAAFLFMEPLETVLKENRAYYATLLGYAMNSDAHHMTAPKENGQGAYEAMQIALDKAGLSPEQIDFVIAHGTGTMANDQAEAAAIKKLFSAIPTASNKGLLGHTLAGAGAINAVAALYSIQNKKTFENFNNQQPGEDCPISLTHSEAITFNDNPIILSNAFAFGGNNTVLIFG